jgi:hypothetical protein
LHSRKSEPSDSDKESHLPALNSSHPPDLTTNTITWSRIHKQLNILLVLHNNTSVHRSPLLPVTLGLTTPPAATSFCLLQAQFSAKLVTLKQIQIVKEHESSYRSQSRFLASLYWDLLDNALLGHKSWANFTSLWPRFGLVVNNWGMEM